MSKKDKLKYKPGLTAEQMEAQDILLTKVKQGPTPYQGPTEIFSPEIFDDLFFKMNTEDPTMGLPADIAAELQEFARTGGKDLQTNALFNAQRKNAVESSREAMRDYIAKSSAAGSVFGSNTRAGAVRAASVERGKMEAMALSEIADYEAKRQANRIQAYVIMSELAKVAQQRKIQIGQLIAAAKDMQNRLSWEVFKERNAEVAQMLHSLWGRNVDFAVEKTPNSMGPILTGAAFLIGTVVSGGNPAVGAGLASAVNASQGGG